MGNFLDLSGKRVLITPARAVRGLHQWRCFVSWAPGF
ncbi:hypothetical protein ABIE28_003723 [Devosia sp. 2618]